eukprot:TRINITY_DN23126_c0_g1_i1.p1 TRINITY_DN23126_c0_g1~~TRINITY_DN23126_c0_g1_i1.p1  ORF type:complete len:545 (+),score=91.43 TRINITY_DN23126_c0_g1_i1:39-1637(+)
MAPDDADDEAGHVDEDCTASMLIPDDPFPCHLASVKYAPISIARVKAVLPAIFAILGLVFLLAAILGGRSPVTPVTSSSDTSEKPSSGPSATPLVESGLEQLVSLRVKTPHKDKAPHESKAAAHNPPVCGRRPTLPIPDSVEQVTVKENNEQLQAWRFHSHSAGCQLGLRAEAHVKDCLRGKWVAFLGASQSSIFAVQLINMLSPGALDAVKDSFSTDGVLFQMLDVIIEDRRVLSKQVVFMGDPHAWHHGGNIEFHSVQKDLEILPGVHGRLIQNVPYRHDRIRITYFLSEYWDEVKPHLDAISAMQHGWQHAEVFTTIAVGTWYAYGSGCFDDWCKTRLAIAGQPLDAILQIFQQDTLNAMPAIKSFCSAKGGRGAALGCTLASLEYCSGYGDNHQYAKIYENFKQFMNRTASENLRFLDLWQLSMQMPDECLYGHFSPASATFTLQVLFSSVCSPKHVAKGTLAAWQGDACRTDQISGACKDRSCWGYHYTWDWALSKPCHLRPALDAPEKKSATDKYAAYSQFTSAGV